MKKVLLVIISMFMIVLFGLNIYEYKKYQNISVKYNNLLENEEYISKIEYLNNEIDKYVELISTKYNLDYKNSDDIIKLENDLKEKSLKLTEDISINNEKINSLTEQVKILTNKYNRLVEEDIKKRTVLISDVMKINQYSIGYPTGCESAALTILLNYWGIPVSINQIVDLLPKGDKPYYENGIKYGGNPYLEFIGHPADSRSYGVYDIPIQNVANNFKPGIINGRGLSLNQVLELVKQNRPVIVWNSMNLSLPRITNSWIYRNTGEKINWLADLHALVVVGYNDNQIITSDSLTGTIRYFDRWTFENRYNAFGKRALYY